MKRTVWILNHYAADMMLQKAGRHYWMAKELLNRGYRPVIFCANAIHNSDQVIEIDGDYTVKKQEGIIFVIVKTHPYVGNGISRIRNMAEFYWNVKKVMRKCWRAGKRPDVILASHVHPLTCKAGIEMGGKWKVPCIVEIRDLWPAELISLGAVKEKSLITAMLYSLEKYLYRKAAAVVFTMEGGARYIHDKKWDTAQGGPINLRKIHYINNGVDLKGFEENAIRYPTQDEDLRDERFFNLVYTGSIRKANQIVALLDTAKELQDEPAIRFLIWGAGDYLPQIQRRIQEEKIANVKYKGLVKRKEIPGILVESDVNIMCWQNMDALKYGCSYNKMFEYLAAGKPIFSMVHTGYSILKKNSCGYETKGNTPKEFGRDIRELYHMSEAQRELLGENAVKAVKQFDFKVLTGKLIKIIEEL